MREGNRFIRKVHKWQRGFVALLFLMTSAFGSDEVMTANQVKALFLLNFASFVTWPALAFNSPDSALHYCVVGETSLRYILHNVIDGERVNNRTLRYFPNVRSSQLDRCHVLAVGQVDESERREILVQVKGIPVLTVGEDDAFLLAGGMISLVSQGAKVRPFVNLTALHAVGLSLNAKLMRLITVFPQSVPGETP